MMKPFYDVSEGKVHPKMKIHHLLTPMTEVHKTFLELHSKTELQLSPKQLK